MFLTIASFKNLHRKPIYHRNYVNFKSSFEKNVTLSSFHCISCRKTPAPNFINKYQCLQYFLKNPHINKLDYFGRFISTSCHLRNKENESKNQNDEDENKKSSGLVSLVKIIFPLVILSQLYLAWQSYMSDSNHLFISWEEFKHDMLAKGEVKQIQIEHEGEYVIVELHDGAILKNKLAPSKFYIMRVPQIKNFEEKLRDTETELGIPPGDRVPVIHHHSSMSGFTRVLGFIALLILLRFLFRNVFFKGVKFSSPETWSFTKAKFTLVDPVAGEGRGVKFSDVAGLKEAKTEILDFVDYLKRPEVYRKLGAKVPKGALLLGPPGCGKTLLAKAVATEANVPFLSMNGSEFIEIIGGLGAARVRDLFKEAKKRSPCIIYIDEIDAIGKKRESHTLGHSEVEQTLNQLLVEMDGVLSNAGVVMLASTNRANVLDAALLRPGRFDRQILIDLPTYEERKEIFVQHLKGIHLKEKPEAYSTRMAHLTPGFSGADIANVCNEAALHAARLQKKVVEAEDLEYAVERVVGGTEKRSSALSPEEKKMLAYYEAGRALTGWLSKYGEALLKITIVSRTDLPGGWTHFSPNDKVLYSSEDLRGKMCMGLGGRVAITLMFNCVTSAGEKDLKKVTKIAYAQVRRFGMNDKIGLLSFDIEQDDLGRKKPYSKVLDNMFDEEARRLVTEVYKETEKLLRENKEKLVKLAEELLLKETLNYDDVVNLLGPPLYKGKKLIEPLEFNLSLDQAVGPEPENTEAKEEKQ